MIYSPKILWFEDQKYVYFTLQYTSNVLYIYIQLINNVLYIYCEFLNNISFFKIKLVHDTYVYYKSINNKYVYIYLYKQIKKLWYCLSRYNTNLRIYRDWINYIDI